MAMIGTNNEKYAARRIVQPGTREISERAFNGIIAAMLLWGFALNYLTVACFSRQARALVAGSPIAFLIGYFVLVIIGSVLIAKPKPILSFIGYNLIAVPIGIVVCTALEGIHPAVVQRAIVMTGAVTVIMLIAGTLFPRFFLSLGRVLFLSLTACLIGFALTSLIFHVSGYGEWIFAAIFSLYIGYDWARANTCAPTVDNAIDLAAELYLDIINLFLRVLSIMNKKNRR